MQARRTGRKNIGSAKQSRADEHLSFRDTADLGTPSPRGLYDPALEKDSCGVGFIADLKGRKSHKIIDDGLTILLNLEHRGAVGADPRMGDGAVGEACLRSRCWHRCSRRVESARRPCHYRRI